MNLYKIQLKLKSPLVTSLKGDTIWGHFVWGIANHEGDEEVAKFLEECKSENPPLIVSSAFFKGTLCKPLPLPKERIQNMNAKEYAKIKENKKSKVINAEKVFATNAKFSAQDSIVEKFIENDVLHNSINRITGTVSEDDENIGNLFSVKELWANKSDFDLYILSTYDEERILQLSKWAFENGYGADSSTGKGNIQVVGKPEKITINKISNLYMALSPFVISENDKIQNLRADTFIRNGKIGGAFAQDKIPWKKTVVLFDEGAVFECNSEIQFVGKILTNIHADKRICQSGFAPVVPISQDLVRN